MPVKSNLLSYFARGWATSWKGLILTFRHLLKARHRRKEQDILQKKYFSEEHGLVTVRYPYESIPVPDHGRYKLHNEIEDCIVCDKCAKICPVDCIEIEPVRSVGEFGKASDGTPKRIYAARFDIDMAKCCFCGLCTTVCPTECLTMTSEYDFATIDVTKMTFGFGNMTQEEIKGRKSEWERHQSEKAAQKEKQVEPVSESKAQSGFRPRMSPARPSPVIEESVTKGTNPDESIDSQEGTKSGKPIMPTPQRPRAAIKPPQSEEND